MAVPGSRRNAPHEMCATTFELPIIFQPQMRIGGRGAKQSRGSLHSPKAFALDIIQILNRSLTGAFVADEAWMSRSRPQSEGSRAFTFGRGKNRKSIAFD